MLIIQNETAGDIELIEIGITVPATDQYDLTLKNAQMVAVSDELATHIRDGNISVVTDTLNTLANTTGYQRLAAGTTSDRPSSPLPGTTRFNTDTNFVEMFMAGNWQNMPHLRDIEFRADPSSSVLYRKMPDGKFLSVATLGLTYASANTANLSWVYIDSNINWALAGYTSAFYGTIVYVGVYTDTTDVTKAISIYVNNDEVSNVAILSGAQTSNSV